ncbi:hypothetical protein NT6N_10450 [Oceaniferula spumae]|uniref:PEP-CTERM protein-sorting domain-containing protein n=1 Tax=Oceaniferula spumae TaxID=2979115 RepID=A0AAT9FJ32_9BACT
MDITNKSRAAGLSAVCAAVGVASALTQATQAASLATDLVVNGGFEADNSATVITGWSTTGGGTTGAYNYDQGYDDRNGAGDIPPGNSISPEDWYWTMNGNDQDAVQTIDLSAGDTATAIAGGYGHYDIQGYFTNYLDNLEGGRLSLEFYDGNPGLDGAGANLLGAAITFDDTNLDEWTLIGGTGLIDSSAQWARIVLGKDPGTGQSFGPDVYVDNVTFFVTAPEPSSSLLALAGASLLVLRRRRC